MKKLVVTANPRSGGFVHKIADRYAAVSRKAGHEVEVMDLYKAELQQDYLRFEDKKDFGKDPTTLAIQAKIKAADEITFVYALWWSDVPAIMKNFWDSNFTYGFAYARKDGKTVGLLDGKTSRVMVTSGAPALFYSLFPMRLSWIWKFTRLGYVGIKTKSFTIFDRIDGRDEASLGALLGKLDAFAN